MRVEIRLMFAWQFSSFGVDSLDFVGRTTPTPGPGEVLVRVRAISLNYRDLLMIKGRYNPKMEMCIRDSPGRVSRH